VHLACTAHSKAICPNRQQRHFYRGCGNWIGVDAMSILDKDSMTEDHWSNNPRFKKDTRMTKEEALQAIKLLSALEAWAMSQSARLPDYVHEDLCKSMEVLERIVLEKP